MGKEDNLLRKAGTKNPFNVPDRYFEDFTQELMNKLPEKEPMLPVAKPTFRQWVKPWVYMAAMFCGIMLSVRIFVGKPLKDEFPISQAEAEMLPDDEWEIMVRRSMMDDYEFYEYLTEADNNH